MLSQSEIRVCVFARMCVHVCMHVCVCVCMCVYVCVCVCDYDSCHEFWFNTVPAECGDPGTPAMGSRMLTGTTQGSTVDYSCQSPGYVLRGNSRKTCQQNGQWSGDSPVCESKSA